MKYGYIGLALVFRAKIIFFVVLEKLQMVYITIHQSPKS